MAMVASGPMPGSTPIKVPSSAPMKQKNRFCSVAAAPKPCARLPRMSIPISPAPERGHSLVQRVDEDDVAEGGEAHRQRQRLPPAHARPRQQRDEHADRDGGGEPRPL